MPEHHSIHQGATIDEAVDRARAGAELDQRINEMRMNLIRRLDAETELAVQAVRDAAQNALQYLNGTFMITDDPDYLAAWTDTEGRLLVGIRKDGSAYFAAGIPPQIADALSEAAGVGDRVANLETNFSSLDYVITNMIHAHSDLVNAAFTGLRKEDDGLWYAYNKRGEIVDGPFDFGGNSAGDTTLAEYFGVIEDDSVTYRDPTPITATEIGPNITLSELLNAADDDSVTYRDPTPIVNG